MPRRVQTSTFNVPVAGFTQAVVTAAESRLVFVSGLTARAATGDMVAAGDMRGQTRQIFRNLDAILAAAGTSLENVVRLVTYVTDMSRLHEMHEVRREFFPAGTPPSSAVEVSRLYDPAQLIEIEATAVIEPTGDAAAG